MLYRWQQWFFMLTPRSSCEGFEDVKAALGSLHDFFHMFVEVKMGVKGYTQDLRVLLQRQEALAEWYTGVDVALRVVGGEKCHC